MVGVEAKLKQAADNVHVSINFWRIAHPIPRFLSSNGRFTVQIIERLCPASSALGFLVVGTPGGRGRGEVEASRGPRARAR